MDDVDICKLSLTQGRASEDWIKDVTVTLYKGKWRRENANSNLDSSLLSVPSICKICGVGELLLDGIKVFYEDNIACV